MDRMIAAAAFLTAVPSSANHGVAIPEPSHLSLFALGAAGVLIGRFVLRPRKRDDEER